MFRVSRTLLIMNCPMTWKFIRTEVEELAEQVIQESVCRLCIAVRLVNSDKLSEWFNRHFTSSRSLPVKLFAANIFTGRDLELVKWRLNHSLNLSEFTNLTAMHNRHTDSCITCSASSSTSVRINFQVIGQFIINNVRDTLNINTACCYVSRDEKLKSFLAKL